MTTLLNSANFHDTGTPKFFALRKATFEAGLLRAGLPEE